MLRSGIALVGTEGSVHVCDLVHTRFPRTCRVGLSLPASFRRARLATVPCEKQTDCGLCRGAIVSKNSGVRSGKPAGVSVTQDPEGREIGNLILRGLPRKESALIFPALEFVRLRLHQVLHEARS